MKKGQKTPPAINALEILKSMHPYEILSTRHRKNLLKRIETMIDIFLKSDKEFKEQITKIEKGEYTPSTLQSLKNICDGMIARYEDQKRITDKF